MSTNPHGILTPANSEEPDLLRNEAAKKAAEQERVANLAQRRKDATSEIERILKCPDNQPREALQVSSEAGDDEALKALRKIGCLILPKLLEYSDTPDDLKARKTAEEAFSKLAKAAHKANVASHFIDDVRDWDGHEDLDQKAEPVKQARQAAMPEIQRINACSADEQTQMLKISQSPSDDESLEAWRKIGCLIAPKPLNYDEEVEKKEKEAADNAFSKLKKAAEDLGVEDRFLSQVELWDGTEDLLADDDDSDSEGEQRMEEDVHPEPPPVIKQIYDQATEAIKQLQIDPDNSEAIKACAEKNTDIANKTNELPVSETTGTVTDSTWTINVSWLREQYKEARVKYDALMEDRENQAMREQIAKIKDLVDKEIARKYYPTQWGLLSADECITLRDNEGNTSEPTELSYPWATKKVGNNLILGYKTHGGRGHQVLVENFTGGRYIRRIMAAGEVGLRKVTEYRDDRDALDLAAEQKKDWGIAHRKLVKDVLWASQARVQRKNLAANTKNGDMYAAVTVLENGQLALKIWSFSTLSRVIGQGDARAEVKRCCLRDRIETPWDAGPVETYYDESRVEQDPQRRAELRDQKSAANSQFSSSALKRGSGGRAAGGLSASFAPNIKAEATSEGGVVNRVAGSESVESRMDKLEGKVSELTTSVILMNDTFTKLLEAMGGNGTERDSRRR